LVQEDDSRPRGPLPPHCEVLERVVRQWVGAITAVLTCWRATTAAPIDDSTPCSSQPTTDEDEAPVFRWRALCRARPSHPKPPLARWFRTPSERRARSGGWGGRPELLLRSSGWSVSPCSKAPYSTMLGKPSATSELRSEASNLSCKGAPPPWPFVVVAHVLLAADS
jgi:hypothetical protein